MKKILFIFYCLLFNEANSQVLKSPNDMFKTKTVKVSGQLKDKLNTGFNVEVGDFVYIEVQGKITLGAFAGECSGIGKNMGLLLLGYNKYPSYWHGCLVFSLGNDIYPCEAKFIADSPIYNYMVDKSHMITDDMGLNFVPAAYFISKTSGMLTIELNDKDTNNNSGEFTVTIYKLSKSNHLNRNVFNFCPKTPPSKEIDDSLLQDIYGNVWFKEGIKSSVYHGVLNESFRGTGKYIGSQCVYYNENLITNDENEGTFDLGFWLKKSTISNEALHLHLIFDMLPHDLGLKNYKPIPQSNIYK